MSIHGTGAVDGDPSGMSSARVELHGQTAMAVMSKVLLDANNETNLPTILQGDNQGIQNKCNTIQTNRLKHHREPNSDLLMEYQHAITG